MIMLGLAAILAAAPAWAVSGVDQRYDTFAWREYPDLRVQGTVRSLPRIFPDYDSSVLGTVEYAEFSRNLGLTALITCTTRLDGHLAVIHYSMDGFSRIVLPEMPLYTGQTTTYCFDLPEGTGDGLTRVMLWRDRPEISRLDVLARYPNQLEEPVPGLLTQEWFSRGEAQAYFPPWEDQFRPDFDRPGITAKIGWPLCRAVPSSDGGMLTKDCTVLYTGQTELGFDEYGAYGVWDLDWSSELRLVFPLTGGDGYMTADLVVYIGRDTLTLWLSQSSLEVTVNGWSLSGIDILQTSDDDMQPYAVDVSHYLTDGINTISLKPNPFAGADILIHGIELWAY